MCIISKKLFLTERLILNKISTISSPQKFFLSQKISSNMGSSTVRLQYVWKTKFTYLLKYKWYIISERWVCLHDKIHIYDWVNFERTVTKNMEIGDLKSPKHLDCRGSPGLHAAVQGSMLQSRAPCGSPGLHAAVQGSMLRGQEYEWLLPDYSPSYSQRTERWGD